jgi:hypothetical protein
MTAAIGKTGRPGERRLPKDTVRYEVIMAASEGIGILSRASEIG